MPQLMPHRMTGGPTEIRRGCARRIAPMLMVASVTACTGASGSNAAQPTTTAPPAPPSSTAASPNGSQAAEEGLAAVPEVAARLQPSAVTVLVNNGLGSGVVYSSDGLIVTNEHVVRGNSTVQIAFADGQRVAGKVRAVDAVTDLALVQADRKGVPPVTFEPKLPVVGSLTVVIGSPLGFQNSVTAGVISGLHREIPGSATEGQSLVDLIQTDAPISPGNSGGAVADADGKIIGISEAYIPPTQGAVALGFAIPAATVQDIVGQLQKTGRARHAYAGLVPAAITPDIAQQLGLNSTEGVIIVQVERGGPADDAGLSAGDIITAVDGTPTATPEDFLAALRPHEPGDTLTLTVHSPGGQDRQVRLTVTDRPAVSNQ